MRSARTLSLLIGVVLLAGMIAAPAADAVTGDTKHPSSDAPWIIGALVLVLLGMAAVMLLLRRKVTRTSGTDFRR